MLLVLMLLAHTNVAGAGDERSHAGWSPYSLQLPPPRCLKGNRSTSSSSSSVSLVVQLHTVPGADLYELLLWGSSPSSSINATAGHPLLSVTSRSPAMVAAHHLRPASTFWLSFRVHRSGPSTTMAHGSSAVVFGQRPDEVHWSGWFVPRRLLGSRR